MAHYLQVDAVLVMRMSNHEELINPGAKGIPLDLVKLGHDLDSTGHERAGPL